MVVLGNGHVHIKHVVVFCCLDSLHLQWELLLDCNTAWNILVADESSHWKRAACIMLLQCYPTALLLLCSRDEGSRCARPLKGKPKDEMWMYLIKKSRYHKKGFSSGIVHDIFPEHALKNTISGFFSIFPLYWFILVCKRWHNGIIPQSSRKW